MLAVIHPTQHNTISGGCERKADGKAEFKSKFPTRICPYYLHVVDSFKLQYFLPLSSQSCHQITQQKRSENIHRRLKDQILWELHEFYASPGKLEARWTTTSTPTVTHLAILGTRSGFSLSPPQNHHHWLHLSALLRNIDETPLFQTPIQLEMHVDLVRALSRSAYSPYRRGRLRHS